MQQQDSSKRPDLSGVVTNVITGFLGSGKTTAILHLLQQRPATERWAVLVNEFGEVGLDGSLLHGDSARERSGVFIREVPGGCMCCAAGVPMQIALTALLAKARPDRLLIEPTGLGHPQEVLEVLTAEHYRRVLDLKATVTLIDARRVRDPRFADHPTFLQQLEVADVLVANKADLYEPADRAALSEFLARSSDLQGKSLFEVEQGALELEWLSRAIGSRKTESHGHGHEHEHEHEHHDHGSSEATIPPSPETPATGFVRVDNEGEGFFSRGWIFAADWVFDDRKLYAWLSGLDAERFKGVFVTGNGIAFYNMVDGVVTKTALSETLDSRVEILGRDAAALEEIEESLLGCAVSRS